MLLSISRPMRDSADPGYVQECRKVLQGPASELIEAFSVATGSRRFAASLIATAVSFPGEVPRAEPYLEMMFASARSAGWADFAIKAALPMVLSEIVAGILGSGSDSSPLVFDTVFMEEERASVG